MAEPALLYEYVDATGDCWEWKLKPTTGGYGRKSFRTNGKKRNVQAHRWVWEQLVGAVPDGLQLDHLCRNRICVNPDHLEPVTAAENLRRGRSRFSKQGMTHCRRGHSLSDAYQYGNGPRNCRQCAAIRYRGRTNA